MIKKIILIILGLVLLVIGGRSILLIAMGDNTQGIVDRARTKSVTTQTTGQRRSIHKPTGYYYIKTDVDYHFDVLPTPVEALQRLSEAPIAQNVSGSDLIVELSRDTESSFRKGSNVDIIFLRKMPTINAVYQPNRLKTYGGLQLVGGLILIIWGVKSGTRRAGTKEHIAA